MNAATAPAIAPADEPESGLGGYILIRGQTSDGRKFRPSDWSDRLFGSIAVYAKQEEEENFQKISSGICQTNRDGIKGIVMNAHIEHLAPKLFRFLNNFAKDNNLMVENLDDAEWNADRKRVVIKPKRQFT